MKRVPLQRKTGLRRLTQLRPRSKKRAELYAKHRVPLVKELLEARPLCELGPRFMAVDPTYTLCTYRATCCHEVVKRSAGGDVLDRSIILTSCWPCNVAAEDFPALGRRAGVVKRRGDIS